MEEIIMKNRLFESISILKELLEEDFKKVTDKQKDVLRSQFNKAINFEYMEDGCYIFIMSEESFKSFNYYYGMEYETPESTLIINGYVLVIYEYGCERAQELFELLEENRSVEE
jgi:hypothetical protein